MIHIHEKFIVDEAGQKKAVIISLREWERIKEVLEEYDDIRAYDEAKSRPSEPIRLEEAIKT